MRRISWRTIVSIGAALLASVVVCVGGAAAKPPPAPNGQILFGNPDGVITTVNPDGSNPNGLITADCGRWSPNGSMISTCGGPDPGGSTLLLDPLTGTVLSELFPPDPTLFLACYVWSPDGAQLACEQFQATDDLSRSGLYTVRASDGGDIQRLTFAIGGPNDNVGDYSPDGTEFVFGRIDPTRPPHANNALFVTNVDRTGLRRITPWGFPFGDDFGSWSPNGDWILFNNHKGKVFVVHPDGTDLHMVPLAGVSPRSFAFQPSWSPDGTRFVFAMSTPLGTPAAGPSRSPDFREGIYTANANGSDVQPVNIAPPGTCCDDGPDWGTHALAGP
jgi:Tol biopolymer transport system component